MNKEDISADNKIQDKSGNGNTGTFTSALSLAAGKEKEAMTSTPAGPSLIIPHSAVLSVKDNLSVSLWLYPTAESSAYAALPVAKWGSGGTDTANYTLYYFGNYGGLYPYQTQITSWLANAGGVWSNISNYFKMPLNTWHHIVLSYNSVKGGQLYVNGVASGGPVASGELKTNTGDLIIGNGFPGLIDDVRIYNRLLTDQDVLGLYSAGSATKSPSVVPSSLQLSSLTTAVAASSCRAPNVAASG